MYKVSRVVTEQSGDYFKKFNRKDWPKWIKPNDQPSMYRDIAAICFLYAMELQDILKKVKKSKGVEKPSYLPRILG